MYTHVCIYTCVYICIYRVTYMYICKIRILSIHINFLKYECKEDISKEKQWVPVYFMGLCQQLAKKEKKSPPEKVKHFTNKEKISSHLMYDFQMSQPLFSPPWRSLLEKDMLAKQQQGKDGVKAHQSVLCFAETVKLQKVPNARCFRKVTVQTNNQNTCLLAVFDNLE